MSDPHSIAPATSSCHPDQEARPRKRLWIVSELYYPEQTSTGYFLTRIAEGLAGDYDVHVASGQPSYSERGVRAPSIERRHGTLIHRLAATRFNKDRLALRAVNLISFTASAAWFLLWSIRRGDGVLVVTNPPALPLFVAAIARLKRARAVLLVHDVYPELLAATGIMSARSFTFRCLSALFDFSFRLFDTVVVLGRDMAEVVSGKLGTARNRIRIIPNWADLDEVLPIPREENPFRQELGLDNRFIVQFSGNIGRTHDIELILSAAGELRNDPKIAFLFVGYGGKSPLVQAARDSGLDNLIFLPRQPRERLGAMLAASDLTIISFVPGMFGLSVPSRMYNVMAAGVPIAAITDPGSELACTVSENNAGWVLAPGDLKGLVALIRSLAAETLRNSAQAAGRNGRAAVESNFTLPKILDLYRDVFA